ncbi:MAG: twin-arginine translocase subunit TatB [Proteobacteria bacterium]|nr:twin-arginine translocase subunit TatB [Pseudomonadota bacterium]
MLDIGWSELLLIGVVALIVVGPKDLPVMFRTLGRFTAKARSMAREFQRAMDDAAKSTGVHETMKDVRDLTSKKSLGLTALENAADKFEKWNPMKPEARPASPAPTLASAQPAKAEPAATETVARSEPGPATKALAEKVARQRKARQAKANGRDGGEGVALDAEPAPAEGAAPAEPARTRRPRAKAAPAAPNGAAPAKPAGKDRKSKADPARRAAAAVTAPAARARKSPTKKIDA